MGKFMMTSFKPLLGDCIDDVYKSNQNMGLLFNCKMGDPRILEPLNTRFEWVAWSVKNAKYLLKSLIQNVEGETVCLDSPDFTVRAVAESVEITDAGIDGIVSACVELMPNLSVRKVTSKGDSQIVVFAKCGDKCAICKRVHVGNRQYVVYFPDHNTAFFKCHDDEAKDKKLNLIPPDVVVSVDDIKSMIPMADEAEAEAESEDHVEEVRLLNSPLTDEDFSEYFVARYPNQFIMADEHLHQFGSHTWAKLQG